LGLRGIIKVGVVAQFSRVGERRSFRHRDRPIIIKSEFLILQLAHTHKVSDEEDSLFCFEGFSLFSAKRKKGGVKKVERRASGGGLGYLLYSNRSH
jgi:hypothetical protein